MRLDHDERGCIHRLEKSCRLLPPQTPKPAVSHCCFVPECSIFCHRSFVPSFRFQSTCRHIRKWYCETQIQGPWGNGTCRVRISFRISECQRTHFWYPSSRRETCKKTQSSASRRASTNTSSCRIFASIASVEHFECMKFGS
jgi:hypothetical protein